MNAQQCRIVAVVLCAALFLSIPPARAIDVSAIAAFSLRRQLSFLETDLPVRAGLVGGTHHLYIVDSGTQRLLWLELEQEGAALEARVIGAEGRVLFQTRCEEGVLCRGPLIWPASASQTYVLAVTAKPARRPLCYTITVRARDDASAGAAVALTTVTRMLEAESMLSQGSAVDVESALPLYLSALQAWTSIGQPSRQAEAFCRIGDILALLGRNREALGYFEHAAEIWGAQEDHASAAYAGVRMGRSLNSLADASGAMEHLRAALEHFLRSGNKHGQALAYHNLGEVYYSTGDANEALLNFRRSLGLWPLLGERRAQAITLLSAAAAHAKLNDFHTSVDLNRQALPVLQESGDRAMEALLLSNLGMTYNEIGDFQKALDSSHEALDIQRERSDLRGQAQVLNNLGQIYHNAGDLEKAISFYTQSLDLRRKSEDPAGEAVTLNNIGRFYLDRQEYGRALDSFRQSFGLIRGKGYRAAEAAALLYIGQAEIFLRDYDAAEVDLRRAREIFVQLEDRYGNASCIVELARIGLARGSDADAIALYREALVMMQGIADRPGEARALLDLARIYRARGEWDEAAGHVEQSIRILESIRAELLTHALRVSYLSASRGAYEFYVDLLYELHSRDPGAGYEEVAFRVSEGAHARSLSDLLSESSRSIRSGVDAGLLAEEGRLRQRRNELQQARLEAHRRQAPGDDIARIDAEIESARVQLDLIEARIRRESPAYYSLVLPAPARLPEVQDELLDADTVLVEFLLGRDRGFAWVLNRAQKLMYSIPGSAELQKRIFEISRLLSRPDGNGEGARLRNASEELGRMLLGPAVEMIGKRRVLIVGDGALHVLPFAVLQLPGRPQPMGIEQQIVYLPSATSLILMREEMKNRPQPDRSIAVFADPVFDPADPRIQAPSGMQRWLRSPQSLSLTRIPFTRREARAILQFVPRGDSFLAMDTEAALETLQREEMSRYRYLHIATHGILDTSQPELSGLVLSLYSKDGRPRQGLLNAADIFNLKLNADLVVLSGCNTALGKDVRGEGLVGLVRAFMHSGARSVIAGLWSVEDAATVEFMTYFYRAMIVRKLSPIAALHETQKFMWRQERWRAPYYWAAFALVGEFNLE